MTRRPWGVSAPFQYKTVHGTHQAVFYGAFRMDRTGLVTGSAQIHNREAPNSLNVSLFNLGAAPATISGVIPVSVERSYNEAEGLAIYTYTYEGVNSAVAYDDSYTTFELDITMTEEPIETHPSFEQLKVKYGWNAQKRQFAETQPTNTANQGTGLSGPAASTAGKSPLYGTDSYLAFGCVFRKTYVRASIPGTVLSGVGAITAAPPGIQNFRLPNINGRNWLKIAPHIRRRGACVEITEQWMLSGPYGWVPDVYNASALAGKSAGGGGVSSDGFTSAPLQLGSL